MTEQRTIHQCGGTLIFIRQADGRSIERCDGCGWYYNFDAPSVNDISGTRTA